jgi:hypothetical protein
LNQIKVVFHQAPDLDLPSLQGDGFPEQMTPCLVDKREVSAFDDHVIQGTGDQDIKLRGAEERKTSILRSLPFAVPVTLSPGLKFSILYSILAFLLSYLNLPAEAAFSNIFTVVHSRSEKD